MIKPEDAPAMLEDLCHVLYQCDDRAHKQYFDLIQQSKVLWRNFNRTQQLLKEIYNEQ